MGHLEEDKWLERRVGHFQDVRRRSRDGESQGCRRVNMVLGMCRAGGNRQRRGRDGGWR